MALAVSLLAGCSLLPAEEEALAPPLVRPQTETFDVVEVKRGTIQTFLRGTATFTSSKTEPLYFKESGGRINTVLVKLGEKVEAGQPVVELDTGDLELRTKLQRLSVEEAQIAYRDAQTGGASSGELRLKQIALERERLTLEALESQLAKSKLISPIAGIVTYMSDLAPGDSVTGYETIVTVADPTQVRLTYQAASANELMAVQGNMAVGFRFDGETFAGKVLQAPSNAPVTLDKEQAEKNATLLIMELDEPIPGVEIGDRADFEIALQTRENVLMLPRSGVRSYLGRDYVQIAEGERRKEIDVEVGLKTSTEVEIVRGLEEGQQVIMNN